MSCSKIGPTSGSRAELGRPNTFRKAPNPNCEIGNFRPVSLMVQFDHKFSGCPGEVTNGRVVAATFRSIGWGCRLIKQYVIQRTAAIAWLGLFAQGLPIGAEAAPGVPVGEHGPDFAWALAAISGWSLCLLLVAYLIIKQKKWRAAFETKEWLLLPSETAHQVIRSLESLANMVSNTAEQVAVRADLAKGASVRAVEETRGMREEFGILREELESRHKELKASQLGQEFHYRRAVLMRVIRALEIIDEDAAQTLDPSKTIHGIKVELEECLQDNHVHIQQPNVGQRIADTVGFDSRSARREPTDDPSLRGTVASVERPAYVVTGPRGLQETLVPARVTVFV